MIKKLTIVFIHLIFMMGCGMSNDQGQEYEIPESSKAVHNVLYEIAMKFQTKFKMKPPIATNIAMPGGIVKELGLDFQVQGPLSKEEIRKILVGLAQEFVAIVNNDEAVRPYLENYPFEIKNVDITLFFVDSKRHDLYDPDIGIAEISREKLEYDILTTKDGIPSFKSQIKETYEEALKTMQKN